ncbi:hypothetical protein NC653_016982 [Populus alba x Populus x berolinensis]|uniref:Uncharacterized protein n=1 Tax=Populus alba x Populus x berolinensis TaxID=444605 RepID=A0AAD6QP42_9ROSI|nr:hypothetical protein NC653_016982 [Populus alba x Populus x berolinensis]
MAGNTDMYGNSNTRIAKTDSSLSASSNYPVNIFRFLQCIGAFFRFKIVYKRLLYDSKLFLHKISVGDGSQAKKCGLVRFSSLMLERNLKVATQELEDDDAVRYKHFLPCKNLGYQIVASEVDEKLFSSENVAHGRPTFDAMLGAYVFAHM